MDWPVPLSAPRPVQRGRSGEGGGGGWVWRQCAPRTPPQKKHNKNGSTKVRSGCWDSKDTLSSPSACANPSPSTQLTQVTPRARHTGEAPQPQCMQGWGRRVEQTQQLSREQSKRWKDGPRVQRRHALKPQRPEPLQYYPSGFNWFDQSGTAQHSLAPPLGQKTPLSGVFGASRDVSQKRFKKMGEPQCQGFQKPVGRTFS